MSTLTDIEWQVLERLNQALQANPGSPIGITDLASERSVVRDLVVTEDDTLAVTQALHDLLERGFIVGKEPAERGYPIFVSEVTTAGRNALRGHKPPSSASPSS